MKFITFSDFSGATYTVREDAIIGCVENNGFENYDQIILAFSKVNVHPQTLARIMSQLEGDNNDAE